TTATTLATTPSHTHQPRRTTASTPPLTHPFFFTATATTGIYTLSLHDALPIWARSQRTSRYHILTYGGPALAPLGPNLEPGRIQDRKSTRLNSSHRTSSYAVFCLKKKTSASVAHTVGSVGTCLTMTGRSHYVSL